MAYQDQKETAPGNKGAASPMEGALNVFNATSKNMQAIAGQIFDISKHSFEHTTQTLEKLRSAHGMDEVVAIQTNFIKEAFDHAAQHARKFSELMTAFPADLTKTYQDAWLKSLNSTVKATESASQTAAENIGRLSEATRKASNIFEHRESA
jgi:phasin family protein